MIYTAQKLVIFLPIFNEEFIDSAFASTNSVVPNIVKLGCCCDDRSDNSVLLEHQPINRDKVCRVLPQQQYQPISQHCGTGSIVCLVLLTEP